ncbi:vacuolar ATPase assembly integral membrane protein VMA21 homolog [Chrysoperla carnea]|uniref:vacuolar ATPase assembly integral membrane protein VMA21 homolog n=1 Tax=Chrysoperla carnea TaxID=189513 RepID=UPI001D0645EC|nr:vacuolar ATPase assembly integral membrane protein VMA21 homolog [Chrysoperla carnea]
MGDRKDIPDFKIFSIVFFYCVIIIALPVATFFGTKIILFDGVMGLSEVASNVWSAVFAVIALHVALGIFIHKAYSGDSVEPEKPIAKID